MPTSRSPATTSAAPRSLADALRSQDEDALTTLLRERGDLAVPLPRDLTGLAVRAASRASVQRAVDGLDTPALQVLEILAALPEPATAVEVSRLHGASAAPQLARLRALALLWGDDDQLHLVRAARDLVGPYPAGLGPSLPACLGRRSPEHLAELAAALGLASGPDESAAQQITEHLEVPAALQALLATAPDGARAVLDRLDLGAAARQAGRRRSPGAPQRGDDPVRWLLAHGLLAVADPGTVVLPREIALSLREGRSHRPGSSRPPDLPSRAVTGADQTAALAAVEAVRLVEALGEAWGRTRPPCCAAAGWGCAI